MARAVLHWLAAAHIAAVAFLQKTSNLSFGMILSGFCMVLVALAHFAEGSARRNASQFRRLARSTAPP